MLCFPFLVLSMPDTVEEICPEMPCLDSLLKDVSDVSESGARYSDMPEVRGADGKFECIQTAAFFRRLVPHGHYLNAEEYLYG